MAWLVSGEKVLAAAEVASGRRERSRGLIGRPSFEGAYVIDPARSVHSFGMAFDLDVAFVRADGTVIRIVRLRRRRITRPAFGARWVIEATAGEFERWGLAEGDLVEVRR